MTEQSFRNETFQEACLRSQRNLLTRAFRWTRNWQDAQDVVQETLARAWEKLDQWRGGGDIEGWLIAIQTKVIYAWWRKKKREPILQDGCAWKSHAATDIPAQADDGASPHSLETALKNLPAGLAEFVWTFVDCDCDIKATAERLQISEGYARRTLSRFKDWLGDSLGWGFFLDMVYAYVQDPRSQRSYFGRSPS